MTMGLLNENPTLAKVLNDAVKAGALDLRVCLPARVEKYDSSSQKVNALPLLRQVKIDDREATQMPQITNVPVVFPSSDGGYAYISIPIKAGDLGWLFFADRGLGEYLSGTGQVVTPSQLRDHDLSDAVFIPGGRPFGSPLSDVDEDNIIAKNSNLKMTIDPLGKISIENISSATELLAIFDSVINNLLNADFVVSPPVGELATHTHTITQPVLSVNLNLDKADLATLLRT